jgi:hypothetical protein
MQTVYTESGSTYELDGTRIRRINLDATKRADGEWLQLLATPDIIVGASMLLQLEPLNSFGPDDYGMQVASFSTTRITTPVIKVEVN